MRLRLASRQLRCPRVRLMRCAAVPYIIFGMQINTGTGIGLVIGILKTEEMFGKR